VKCFVGTGEGSQKVWRRSQRFDADTIELIRQMAKENPFWGAERIRGEMLKLGTKVSKRTVHKYMVRAPKIAVARPELGDISQKPCQ
jgi:hypothetical protein